MALTMKRAAKTHLSGLIGSMNFFLCGTCFSRNFSPFMAALSIMIVWCCSDSDRAHPRHAVPLRCARAA